jgi:hypothetical protein
LRDSRQIRAKGEAKMKARALIASAAFALVLAGAAGLVYFALPDALAALVAEQVGQTPAEFVRSLAAV